MSDSLDLFKKPQALDSAAHRQLRFSPNQPYHYAAKQLFAPITLSEAGMIAREYALVFSDVDGSLPMALLGRARGSNSYVRSSGHWTARYVPAHIRRYPFVMAERPAQPEVNGATEAEKIVMFDTEAPHLQAQTGDPLFDDQGGATATLRNVMQVLVAMDQDSHNTLRVMAQLEALSLLVAQPVVIASKQGQPIGLQGLRVIDFDRFNALDAEQLAQLREAGALNLIYAHQISLANLRDGVLVETEVNAPSNSSGSISFDGIDWSKF